jgi:hypothetical protein
VDHGDIDGARPKHLRENIHEVKKGQARVFCYKDGACWKLTNGALKRGNKAQDRDIDRAIRIMKENPALRKSDPKSR